MSSKIDYFIKGLYEKPKYTYTSDENKEFMNYIEKNYGKIEKVYRELYSPTIHIDILLIAPTKERDCYTLITEGIGSYKMNIPKEIKNLDVDRQELVVYLPKDWGMNLEDERYKWVISKLKEVGNYVIDYNDYFISGHTLSYSESNDIPIAKDTKFTSLLFLNAIDKKENPMSFDLSNRGKINFYQLVPLYKEEIDYKQKHGLDELLKLFYERDLIIDLNRENRCINFDKELEDIELEME